MKIQMSTLLSLFLLLAFADECEPGTFKVKAGVCRPCPKGTFQANKNRYACRPCPLRRVSTEVGSTKCPEGSIPNEHQSECICAPRYVQRPGKCVPCKPGTFFVEGRNSRYCDLCKAGEYQPKAGQTKCLKCPEGSNSGDGATECITCKNGESFNKLKMTCETCKAGAPSQTLVSSNEAEIKIWSIQEKKIASLISMNPFINPSRGRRQIQSRRYPSRSSHPEPRITTNSSLTHNCFFKFPRLEFERYSTIATEKHTYRIDLVSIHSLSLNSDARTLLTADEFQINLLSLENYDYKVRLLDLDTRPIKPVSDGIVAACFHPNNCNLLAYANKSAAIRMFDLRDRNAMKHCVSRFEEPKSGRKHSSFFSVIASTMSDFKFSRTGPFLLTRDYMNLRLWDMRVERAPIRIV